MPNASANDSVDSAAHLQEFPCALLAIHGQCLKSTLSAVGNPLKTKGHL